MDRSGYPVEIAIGLLVMAAFLLIYREFPTNAPATEPAATTAATGS
jgi:hypothetical protein